MTTLPYLLVLSQVVPETSYAGSLLLYRLLKTYPPDRLLVIGPLPQKQSERLGCRYESLSVPLERMERTRFARLTHTLRTLGLLPCLSIRDVKSRLRGFRPEVVLTVMQVEAYYSLAADFSRQAALPLVLIVHDLAEEFEPVYRSGRAAQARRNERVYRTATRRFCISPAMNERLTGFYGVPGEVLYPNRSETLTPRTILESATLKTPGALTLGYAGSLAYGYGQGLIGLVPALEKTGGRLRIYTDRRLAIESPCVEYCGRGTTPEATWERIKVECDAVVLPYAHDPAFRSLYETHFPSKLPEYLALGMSVLITGPGYATGVRWGRENPGGAWVLEEDDEDARERALERLTRDGDLRQELARTGIECGQALFAPETIRENFLGVVSKLADENVY